MPKVVIVHGPPGSGKSTYVREHKSHSDIVIDMDALYQALTCNPPYQKPVELFPFVDSVREFIVSNFDFAPCKCFWIITTDTKVSVDRMAKKYGADVVFLDVSMAECLRRISKDKARGDWMKWKPLVEKYFRVNSDKARK
jgi:shikimate kinase